MMTYREMFISARQRLAEAGIAEAENDAWLMLSDACGIDRTFYYMHMEDEVDEAHRSRYHKMTDRRCSRIPLQYITGSQEFMGLHFAVNPHVLIPRQDTETLVEEAIRRAGAGMRVMDMCTGSGCILVGLMTRVPNLAGFGYDISPEAVAVARANAREHHVQAQFAVSDLFGSVTERDFDLILSNPPYIRTADIVSLMPEVAEYEPHLALDGGEDGLCYYRILIEEGRNYLKEGGMLLMEIGFDQGEEVSGLMRWFGYHKVQVIKDLTGNDRVVVGGL